MEKVRIWKENITLPTYDIGTPEKNPVFIEKRVYQGSSGAVYPYPVIEKIHDTKINKTYIALFLENQFIKIMVLPELGGRIQMAYDKTKERHFVYYNQVIKPALVGLTGPWISGGIEFNWPQHHRPTTFDPVDYLMEEHKDGSATIWCSELERMFRTKGMAGFTLHPDKSYIEIKAKIYNKTPLPQTFLWWANPAVKVNDAYQSVFPPDVNAVFDHGKRDVSSFPIAKGTYYKVDYSPGTDISRYKNIPVPTSYMAITSKYNFVGGYENDSKAGLLHVANHHISPGKKQWTWGNGNFGHAWDRNLTDEDGPYIELMCGVYTDNQPDFTWLMPEEEKDFVQYFMPYRDLGAIKNATKNAMVNIEQKAGSLIIKVHTTGIYPNCSIRVLNSNETILVDSYMASPSNSYEKSIAYPAGQSMEGIHIVVQDYKNNILVEWKWEEADFKSIPDAARPALLPSEIEHHEQLFLTGQHLEQYRHATFSPVPYYKEALQRDPKDTRCNNAMGLWLLRRAKFKEAEAYFQKSIVTITERNPNPYDGEPFFNLGLALKYQGKHQKAYNAFYKSVWNSTWQNPGYLHIAQLDTVSGNYQDALLHIDKSISRNTNDHKALHLKIALLRLTGENLDAYENIETALNKDPFNFGVLFEKYLLDNSKETIEELHKLTRRNIHNYIEYALDYAASGLYNEGIRLLEAGINQGNQTYPMGWYYLGWMYEQNNEIKKASLYYEKGSKADPKYCFPNQIEAVLALSQAILNNPNDAKAPYYLGNFWYAAKQYEDAMSCWEKSIAIDSGFATIHRNLSLAYFNKKKDAEQALKSLEKAFKLDPTDARILMELDQLYKRLNYDLVFRLSFLEANLELVIQRDDVYLERINLYNLLGKHEKAFTLIKNRKFHPWEGGEGKVTGQYVTCLVEMAKNAIHKDHHENAINYLEQAQFYPDNLGEGKLYGAQENDIYFWTGIVLNCINKSEEALVYWKKATTGIEEPTEAIYYNDQQPDKIFYQGLANLKLGEVQKAIERFKKLIHYGHEHRNDIITIDYFAVSLPDLMIWEDNLDTRNYVHCTYLMALGYLGLNQYEKAKNLLNEIIAINPNHMGATIHLNIFKYKHLLFDSITQE
ncbi:DUF5107 domain-containing protein [Galbibacter pacificus]|uniref:DUF5107 domain-containing protein n=1 Tax=Galbibacter pacificus TaxID=2996052 RepID=A0ABT6FMT0_9FLAO|nr:DUF5107 domain-containing protein [Galbibacter pacificus]MDG3581091.1 DUF5107 domain-containing protein [Galbibacter pacificus]MDG3584569.1 DUF5107 domain-containing protein [Galbibacter pacificus]